MEQDETCDGRFRIESNKKMLTTDEKLRKFESKIMVSFKSHKRIIKMAQEKYLQLTSKLK